MPGSDFAFNRYRLSVACICVALLGLSFLSHILPSQAQETLRQRLRSRFNSQGSSQPDSSREDRLQAGYDSSEKCTLAGLDVAVWRPAGPASAKRSAATKSAAAILDAPAPLVIFSHGFHGGNKQSEFIMRALADDGYLVVAPNHKDHGFSGGLRPPVAFSEATNWTEDTFKDRHDDIVKLIEALHQSPQWNKQIDWSRLALMGHSLGGYTVLALAGGWPSWKIPGIKAVVALSPYCQPMVLKGNLGSLKVPVMYQGGTRDLGVTPFVKRAGGAYSKTSSPAYFVEFDGIGHFGWSGFNDNRSQQNLINHYCLAFLDKYVKDRASAKPGEKLAGVTMLESK